MYSLVLFTEDLNGMDGPNFCNLIYGGLIKRGDEKF